MLFAQIRYFFWWSLLVVVGVPTYLLLYFGLGFLFNWPMPKLIWKLFNWTFRKFDKAQEEVHNAEAKNYPKENKELAGNSRPQQNISGSDG